MVKRKIMSFGRIKVATLSSHAVQKLDNVEAIFQCMVLSGMCGIKDYRLRVQDFQERIGADKSLATYSDEKKGASSTDISSRQPGMDAIVTFRGNEPAYLCCSN